MTCKNLAGSTETWTITAVNGTPTFQQVNIHIPGRENWLPVHTCGKILALEFAGHTAAQGTAYLLHRTGHHRLEHFPRLYLIAGNTTGFVYSFRHRCR